MAGTIELIGMGWEGHGIYGFHPTFIPAFNSTTARVERPDSEGRRIESQQSEILNLIAENKPGQHSVDRPPSLLVANRYGPTIVRTNVQTLKGDFDQPENFWGPLFMGPCWLSSNVQSAPSIPIAP